MSKDYVPAITSKPQSPEWDASFDRMFGRKPCKGCGCDMAGEDRDALWCRVCKGEVRPHPAQDPNRFCNCGHATIDHAAGDEDCMKCNCIGLAEGDEKVLRDDTRRKCKEGD